MEGEELQKLKIKGKKEELNILKNYSPSDFPLSLEAIPLEDTRTIIVGDFNSHSQSLGYDHLDRRGEEVENWQDENQRMLINSPHDTPTFYSRRWKTTSTPGFAFCTEDLNGKKAARSGNSWEEWTTGLSSSLFGEK